MTVASALASQEKPQRLQSEDLVLEELQNELMLYDSARNKAFCLNQTAAFVWKQSDGKTTVAEMAEMLGKQANERASEQVVWYALDLLSKDGLIAPTTAMPRPPAGVTRRDLLQKVGIGAIPMITVLFVHPAKAHASSIPIPPSGPTGAASQFGDVAHNGGGGFWAWLEKLF